MAEIPSAEPQTPGPDPNPPAGLDNFFTEPQTPAVPESAAPPQPPSSPLGTAPTTPAPAPPATGAGAVPGPSPSGAEPQPTTQQVTDALAAARELGIPVERFRDGADLVRTMWATVENMRAQTEEMRQYAEFGQRVAPQYDAFQAWQQAQQQQQPAPAAAAKPAAAPGLEWKVPEYDPAWERFLQRDDQTGLFKPISPEYAPFAQKANEYAQWRASTGDRMLREFPTLVEQAVASKLQQQQTDFDQRVQQAIAEYEQTQQIQRWEQQLGPHVYTTDLPGNQIVTPWGRKFIDTVQAYRQHGVDDVFWIYEQAMAIAGQPPAAGQAMMPSSAATGVPQPSTPAPVAAPAPTLPMPAAAPAATPGQPQPMGVIPGTQYRVVPMLQDSTGRFVSPQVLSEQQKRTFLQQAAAATHVPSVATTPQDAANRAPITEAELNNFFQTGAQQ